MKKVIRIEIHMTPAEVKRFARWLESFDYNYMSSYKAVSIGKVPHFLIRGLSLYYCTLGKLRTNYTGACLKQFGRLVVPIPCFTPRKPEEDILFIFEDKKPKKTLFD
jgi:hypothetical protein